jgi:hypothetical protein
MKVVKFALVGALIHFSVLVVAQNKVITSVYPGTELKVERVYDGKIAAANQVRETVYYDNGMVWMEGIFSEDAKIQDWTFRYPNGNPYWHAVTVDGKLEGEFKHWYEDGQIAEVIEFRNNQENGRAIFYHTNGQLAMRGAYSDGKMIGEWRFYDLDGKPVKEEFWTWLFFDSAEVRMQGWVKNAKMEGHWEYTETANAGRPYRRQFYLQYQDGELIQ